MKWQYETYSWNSANVRGREDVLIEDLNRYGREGWELVTSVPTKFRGSEVTEQTDQVIFVLKRPIE